MNILVSALKKKTELFGKIAIYGCGEAAKETYGILKRIGKKTDFCVVTKKTDDSVFFDNMIPVYEFSEQAEYIIKNNILLIIGVSIRYLKEIEEIVKQYHVKHYLRITDFEEFQIYNKMSSQEFLEEIAEWYLGKNIEADRQSILKVLHEVIENERYENKIVVAMGALTPRVIKVVKSLLEKGYQIKLIASPVASMQEFCINALDKMEIAYIRSDSIEEYMYRIIMERAKVVHLFTTFSHSHIDRILIKMKELFPPIVYDEYDIRNLCYAGFSPELLDNERFCLENADGICNRGYEVDYLKENGFQIKGRAIQFSDYCNSEQVQEIGEESTELSICYVGNLFSEEESIEWVKNFSDCAQLCKTHNCHFHVYPHLWDEKRLKVYREMDKINNYFHLHYPVSYERLKYELSRYDYGILPYSKRNLEHGILFDQKFNVRTEKRGVVMYAHTNKYFDYLDAGLPIIAAHPIKMLEFLKTKNVVLNWTIEEYNFEYMKRNRKKLKKIVSEKHHELQMMQHIDELIDLYNAVAIGRIKKNGQMERHADDE